MKDKKIIMHEIITAILALVSIFIVSIQFFNILIPENVLHTLIKIDDLIYIVFVIDYITRLSLSKNKRDFIKNNLLSSLNLANNTEIFINLPSFKSLFNFNILNDLNIALNGISEIKSILLFFIKSLLFLLNDNLVI